MPTDALVVVEDVVVLAFYGDEGALAAKQFEGREHLDALVDGHVGVSAAMHEENGRVHLVGIEERSMTAVKLHIVPRVGVCCGGRAVGVAPVAEAPVAGRIADAGMAHGSGEDVGHGLQVHRHEAAVAGSHAPHLVGLDEGMFLAELLGALNDVVGCVVAVGIDMSRSKLLSEAAAARGLNEVNHIAHGCPFLEVVVAVEESSHGRAAAVVIDEHGVLLRLVEEWWQKVAAINGVASLCLEVPVVTFTKLDIFESGRVEVIEQSLLLDPPPPLRGSKVAQPAAVGAHAALADVGQERLLFGKAEATIYIRFGEKDPLYLPLKGGGLPPFMGGGGVWGGSGGSVGV